MEILRNKKISKILYSTLIFLIMFATIFSSNSIASAEEDDATVGGKLFNPIAKLFAGIGDIVIKFLQKIFIGYGDIRVENPRKVGE